MVPLGALRIYTLCFLSTIGLDVTILVEEMVPSDDVGCMARD